MTLVLQSHLDWGRALVETDPASEFTMELERRGRNSTQAAALIIESMNRREPAVGYLAEQVVALSLMTTSIKYLYRADGADAELLADAAHDCDALFRHNLLVLDAIHQSGYSAIETIAGLQQSGHEGSHVDVNALVASVSKVTTRLASAVED